MYLKLFVASIYLALVYWLSLHVKLTEPLFFPTLGAFSYFMITRSLSVKDHASLVFAAAFASLLGSASYLWLPELPAILVTFIVTAIIIRRFQLNAPPILAIALIPFFERPAEFWTTPLTVFVALVLLAASLIAAERVASAVQPLSMKMKLKLEPSKDSLRL